MAEKTSIPRTCITCGSDFLARPSDVRRGGGKFCSRPCVVRDQSGAKNPAWKGGVSKDNMRYRDRYVEKNPEKVRAHNAVQSAIRKGTLVPGPCEICGTTDNIHGHHDDYKKRLKVRWMCHPCHNRYHAELRRKKRRKAA